MSALTKFKIHKTTINFKTELTLSQYFRPAVKLGPKPRITLVTAK